MQNKAEIQNADSDLRFRSNPRVYFVDRLAEGVITLGGMAVLAAVLGIIVYLLWVVLPLAQSGEVKEAGTVALSDSSAIFALDEYQRLGTLLTTGGELGTFVLGTGEPIGEPEQLGTFTAHSYSPSSGLLALGHDSGKLTVGTLEYTTKIYSKRTATEAAQSLELDQLAVTPTGIVERTGEDQYRAITPELSINNSISDESSTSGVLAIDAEAFGRNKVVAVVRDDGSGSVLTVTTRKSLVGGSSRTSVSSLPIDLEPGSQPPNWVVLLKDSNAVFLGWQDGSAQWFAKGNDSYTLAESVRVTDEQEQITTVQPLLGRGTVLIGTDQGRVLAQMLTRETPSDPSKLVHVSTFTMSGGPINAIATSQRDRTFAASNLKGRIQLWHATSGKQVAHMGAMAGPDILAISPKLDGVYALSGPQLSAWTLDAGHPNATVKSLFLPVWYEGDHAPSFVYQSTAADDSAESKMSLTPLVFGTFKATLFAMLFAVPIAVMAAVYASEFMSKSMRNKVKPTVEMMASLPSVVLGFVAAMIVAPFARDHLSAILVGLVLVPMFLVFSSALWPVVSGNMAWRLPQSVQFCFIAFACAIGIALSAFAGPSIDSALFSLDRSEQLVMTGFVEPADELPEWALGKSGFTAAERARLRAVDLYVLDGEVVQPTAPQGEAAVEQFEQRRNEVLLGESPFKLWLTGMVGSAVPGLMALLFVPSLVFTCLVSAGIGRSANANWVPVARVIAAVLVAIPVALLGASVLASLGFDARESLLGTFTQRNTFVVGVIMGFAVIPIIFTISDDALQSVPNTLRSASLGAGATQWQTAIRVVFPVAASGIFSAVMIGLGRAAGETMIVLMATGNTPVMDWNIFGGLRTLSANIAVELPEAERGGTHYRVLFLCGVVLFAITFVINTTAEIIRQHFRKRSAML